MKRISVIVAALAIAGIAVSASPVSAQSDPIKARQALMKKNGGAARTIVGFIKNGKGTAADVAAQAQILIEDAERIPSLFPPGSDMGKTRAKPEIWQNFSKFEGYAATLKAESEKLLAAAKANDKAAIAAAWGGIGRGACGACHQAFRKPKT